MRNGHRTRARQAERPAGELQRLCCLCLSLSFLPDTPTANYGINIAPTSTAVYRPGNSLLNLRANEAGNDAAPDVACLRETRSELPTLNNFDETLSARREGGWGTRWVAENSDFSEMELCEGWGGCFWRPRGENRSVYRGVGDLEERFLKDFKIQVICSDFEGFQVTSCDLV